MNATLSSEPYRLPSGILAVVVHGVFFALLYFGFSWQSVPPATRSVQVDMWASLPEEVVVVVEPAPPVVEEIAQTEQPAEVVKPDIVLKETKKIVAEPVVPKPKKKQVEIKPVEAKPVVAKPVEQKTVEPKPVEPNPAALLAEQQAARERAEKSEMAAAMGRVVDEYKAKIMAKIRSNIVMPPDVAKEVRAEFSVTVLPGGAVLPPKLLKPSGSVAYDNAVERAILKSDPLPLPPDSTLYNRFRELKLVFKPTE